jgi:hypothetical protein
MHLLVAPGLQLKRQQSPSFEPCEGSHTCLDSSSNLTLGELSASFGSQELLSVI